MSLLIVLIILLVMVSMLVFFPNIELSKSIFKKMEKSYFINSFFPVFCTLLLTIILNIALLNLNYFVDNIWETVLVELCFGVLVFFFVDKMQENLMRVSFEETFDEFFSSIKNVHWVERYFAKEFFKGAFKVRSYLEEAFAKDAADLPQVKERINSLDVILAGLNNNGIPLSNYLYSRLLFHCLRSNNIHKIFSIWDIEMVGLDVNQYSEYTRKLKYKYQKITDKENKRRVFIFSDQAHYDRVKPEASWKSLLDLHQQDWGFEEVHYCFNSQLNQVKEGRMEGNKKLEDFLMCCNGNNKWGAGKDKDNGKVFFISNLRVMNETEEIMKTLVTIAEKSSQTIKL